jgi:hypothetical protein
MRDSASQSRAALSTFYRALSTGKTVAVRHAMRAFYSLGVLSSLFAIACSGVASDIGMGGGPPNPGGGSGCGYGDGAGSGCANGVDAGSGLEGGFEDAGSPLDAGSEAAVPNIPPINATPPSNAPALCVGGAAPNAYLWALDGTLFLFDPSSLETQSLGVVSCPTTANPWTLSVTASNTAYVLYDDWTLYEVDLGTLACQATSYQSGQLGFTGEAAITVGADRAADRLYVYGNSASPSLGLSDLSSFRLFPVGNVAPGPAAFPVDLKSDAYGELFALAADGTLEQLDSATGTILGEDHTGFKAAEGAWALMADDGQLYFFGGGTGAVSRYDVATKALFPLGQVNQTVVGASAAPCLSAAAAPPPNPDAGAPTNPFSAGDAWIGTYECPQGLTNLAVVIESVDGNSMNARFDFVVGATPGSFELTGSFDPSTREATFMPGSWVSQPTSGAPAVGMDGFVDLSGQNYSGNITTMGCGAFSVTR